MLGRSGVDSQKVKTELSGITFEITLNRPERKNALDIEATRLLLDALGEAEGSDARAVIIKGVDGCFCSGADLAEVGGAKDSARNTIRYFAELFERVCLRIAFLDLPVIAAMEGPALGGGATLALFSDFRLATPSLRLGIPASRLGITLSDTLVRRIVRVAGQQGALDLLVRSREYTAKEALQKGLVDEVAQSGDQLMELALAVANEIAKGKPQSVAVHKKIIAKIISSVEGGQASAGVWE